MHIRTVSRQPSVFRMRRSAAELQCSKRVRKIFFGIAIELFAVLLQLSLKEIAVSLIVGSLGFWWRFSGWSKTLKD